jgi:hypothetical protein
VSYSVQSGFPLARAAMVLAVKDVLNRARKARKPAATETSAV